MDSEKVAELLLKEGAVSFHFDAPVLFVAGFLSPVYVNTRPLLARPHLYKTLTAVAAKMVKKEVKTDVVAGVAPQGIPFAAWLAEKLSLPLVCVGTPRHVHGIKEGIRGELGKGSRALVVDDVVSTGVSALNAASVLRSFGGIVNHALIIHDFRIPASAKAFAEEKMKVHSLTNLHAILDAALSRQLITLSQKQVIEEWARDPFKWSKKE